MRVDSWLQIKGRFEERFTEWDEKPESGIASVRSAHLLAKTTIKLVR